MRKTSYTTCSKCGDSISNYNFKKHFNTCKGLFQNLRNLGPNDKNQFQVGKDFILLDNKFECAYCKKAYSKHGIKNHIWKNHTKEGKNHNPNRGYKEKTRYAWNRGLTKTLNPSVAKHANSLTGKPSKRKGQKIPDHLKKKLSQLKTAYYLKNPEKHPNRKVSGNRDKMTYPEKVAFDWLKRHNIKFEHNKKIDKYFPDFVSGTVIIEIDGEQWHPIGNEYDATRDLALSSLGFTIFRIRSKEKIEERLNEILPLLTKTSYRC